jgi:uncharacterized damage-inducible protein DinB
MRKLFQYNWQIRDEWFLLCSRLTKDQLLKQHIGGIGSILKTLFHVVEVEYSWIRALQGEPDIILEFNDYMDLELIQKLSAELRPNVRDFLNNWSSELEDKLNPLSWSNESYTRGEILRHIIVHEVHHVGQLSIWAKELGAPVVSANFIGRGLT